MKTLKLILWSVASLWWASIVMRFAVMGALWALSLLVYAGWPVWSYFAALAVYPAMWVWVSTWHTFYPEFTDWEEDNYIYTRGRVVRGAGYLAVALAVAGELAVMFGVN